jgi:cytochrome b561
MAGAASAYLARFGFRSDEGLIDARTWREGAGLLAAIFAVLTAIWLLLEPNAHRELQPDSPLFQWATFLTFVYLLLYAFAVLFIGISLYNLSAKRLRARNLPTGLAGLVPLAALFSGAAHWLQPRVGEYLSYWYVAGIDALLVAALVWTVWELGFRAPLEIDGR